MDFFNEEVVINKIVAVVFVPHGRGKPVHRNRPTHGFAFNFGCATTYRFDTGETLVCRANELIYLPKGANYTVKPDDNTQKNVGVYAVNFLLENEKNFPPKLISVKSQTTLLSLFTKLSMAWRKKEVGYQEECFSRIYSIIKTLKTDLSHYIPAKKSREILAPALLHIDNYHLTETITTAQLAKLCNISEPYLRKLFQNLFGVSPIVYIRNLKIEYAKELLLSAEYSVTEIAMMTGFNDAAYFSREFKKATGISPNGYATLFKAKQ